MALPKPKAIAHGTTRDRIPTKNTRAPSAGNARKNATKKTRPQKGASEGDGQPSPSTPVRLSVGHISSDTSVKTEKRASYRIPDYKKSRNVVASESPFKSCLNTWRVDVCSEDASRGQMSMLSTSVSENHETQDMEENEGPREPDESPKSDQEAIEYLLNYWAGVAAKELTEEFAMRDSGKSFPDSHDPYSSVMSEPVQNSGSYPNDAHDGDLDRSKGRVMNNDEFEKYIATIDWHRELALFNNEHPRDRCTCTSCAADRDAIRLCTGRDWNDLGNLTLQELGLPKDPHATYYPGNDSRDYGGEPMATLGRYGEPSTPSASVEGSLGVQGVSTLVQDMNTSAAMLPDNVGAPSNAHWPGPTATDEEFAAFWVPPSFTEGVEEFWDDIFKLIEFPGERPQHVDPKVTQLIQDGLPATEAIPPFQIPVAASSDNVFDSPFNALGNPLTVLDPKDTVKDPLAAVGIYTERLDMADCNKLLPTVEWYTKMQRDIDMDLPTLEHDCFKFEFGVSNLNLMDAPPYSLIVHACNAQGVWGSGLAKELKLRYPWAYEMYKEYCDTYARHRIGRKLLVGKGFVLGQDPTTRQYIACLITSLNYGSKKDSREQIVANTRKAMESLLLKVHAPGQKARRIKNTSKFTDKVNAIFMPRLNAGLFGVPWEMTVGGLMSMRLRHPYPKPPHIIIAELPSNLALSVKKGPNAAADPQTPKDNKRGAETVEEPAPHSAPKRHRRSATQ